MFDPTAKITAGIIVAGRTSSGFAILAQVRAPGHSYAGALCQTGHGSVEPEEVTDLNRAERPNDVFFKAALRELEEEAGPLIAQVVRDIIAETGVPLTSIARCLDETDDSEGKHFSRTFLIDSGVHINDLLRICRVSEEATEFVAISSVADLLPATPDHREMGVPTDGSKYMRQKDIEIVTRAFAVLKDHSLPAIPKDEGVGPSNI